MEKKLNECQYNYAFQTYGHFLIKIKDILRSGDFKSMEFYVELQCIDDFILDNSLMVDKWIKKYDEILS